MTRPPRSLFESLRPAPLFACVAAKEPAPGPLYRDPMFDAPTDPVLCFNAERGKWLIYYTAGRAIGIAESADGGATWTYLGTADIDYGPGLEPKERIYWAPEVVRHGGVYHLFLTYAPGIFSDWSHLREIVHLTSRDGIKWTALGPVDLRSNRVINACVILLPGGTWRMWYNDKTRPWTLAYADSPDLNIWEPKGDAVNEFIGEGAKVIHWKSRYWLIANCWKSGIRVWSSSDCLHWTPQTPALAGSHGDIVISGDRAWCFYFSEQTPAGRTHQIDVAELTVADGHLVVADPAQPVRINLKPLRETEQ